MKPLFEAFTHYNREVNQRICDFMCDMTEEQFQKKSETYYPRVINNILHVMQSDITWLSRLAFLSEPEISKKHMLPFIDVTDWSSLWKIRQDVAELRRKIDQDIINLITTIENFQDTVEISFGPTQLKAPLWELLLQWFNHQTHHRGQASVLLDLNGMDNDYSLMLDKIH